MNGIKWMTGKIVEVKKQSQNDVEPFPSNVKFISSFAFFFLDCTFLNKVLLFFLPLNLGISLMKGFHINCLLSYLYCSHFFVFAGKLHTINCHGYWVRNIVWEIDLFCCNRFKGKLIWDSHCILTSDLSLVLRSTPLVSECAESGWLTSFHGVGGLVGLVVWATSTWQRTKETHLRYIRTI